MFNQKQSSYFFALFLLVIFSANQCFGGVIQEQLPRQGRTISTNSTTDLFNNLSELLQGENFPRFYKALKRIYYRNDPRDQLFWNQNKYFALRILSQSTHNFVFIYFFVNKYVFCLHYMPDKRRLVTSSICFGSKIAGLLDHSYNKYAPVTLGTYWNQEFKF